MSLLKEMNQDVKTRNFVAKHARSMAGAGEHEVKTKFSRKKRKRDKAKLRKEVQDY